MRAANREHRCRPCGAHPAPPVPLKWRGFRRKDLSMNTHIFSRLARPVALFLLITGMLLLSLNQVAWATPIQSPSGQTVPTKTPGHAPDPSRTPTSTPENPSEPTSTPDGPPEPSSTPDHPTDPSRTPTSPVEGQPAPSDVPGRSSAPTVVPIVAVPSTLPNTGAPASAASPWMWALIVLSLVAGIALRFAVAKSVP